MADVDAVAPDARACAGGWSRVACAVDATEDGEPLDGSGPFCDKVIADDAADKLRLAAARRPFFVVAGLRKPHTPWRYPSPFLGNQSDAAAHGALDPSVAPIALSSMTTRGFQADPFAAAARERFGAGPWNATAGGRAEALAEYPRCPSGRRGERASDYWRDNVCEFVERSRFFAMGASLRVDAWRYTEWRRWLGAALEPDWSPSGCCWRGSSTATARATGVLLRRRENANEAADRPDVVGELAGRLRRATTRG
ncbi:sulfuric ester hydrolase [Aureococcus anophagefferens]|uniref:Sulfuric ester hydrolase n=1 Tax=Aureococcus anophagefferens TaxID=44056 RepID=A0ABR1FLM2_AURAN